MALPQSSARDAEPDGDGEEGAEDEARLEAARVERKERDQEQRIVFVERREPEEHAGEKQPAVAAGEDRADDESGDDAVIDCRTRRR